MKITKQQRGYIKEIIEHLDWPDDDCISDVIDDIQSVLNKTYKSTMEPEKYRPYPLGDTVTIHLSKQGIPTTILYGVVTKEGQCPEGITNELRKLGMV